MKYMLTPSQRAKLAAIEWKDTVNNVRTQYGLLTKIVPSELRSSYKKSLGELPPDDMTRNAIARAILEVKYSKDVVERVFRQLKITD